MADTIKPAHHAWDHMPGGEDPIPGLGSAPDWAQIVMNLNQIIPESASWAALDVVLTTIRMDSYLVSPGGADTEHSATGAFAMDTVNKRVEFRLPGIYNLAIEMSETGEWIGNERSYYWNMTTSGAGSIWNYDESFPLNEFAASPVNAEWYDAAGPFLVWADDVHPVKTDFHVAQHGGFGDAVLGGFSVFMTYVPALNFDIGVTLSDLLLDFP